MRVVHIKDSPLQQRPHVREGAFFVRYLLDGKPGTAGNFSLQVSSTPDGYYSPRHRHNFDQFRYQLEGDFDFGPDGKMTPGSLAYFPEGTHYGPQNSPGASVTLVLQFGGASGSGYISEAEYRQAAAELSATGTFEKGVYTRVREDGRKSNKDAFEAVWEHVNGRPLEYPPRRYERAVFMRPENFHWVDMRDRPGVRRKLFGVFTECGTRAAMLHITPGTAWPLGDHAVYFVVQGRGKVSAKGFSRHTAIHLEPGEEAILTADEETELLKFGLPRF